jgi:crotonobetainyl-CoA:carnitine CoA-transferase CaiB-like acyl-CoA transferase
MILADLGARVIKIERPGVGDETRTWGPPFAPSGDAWYFRSANRNKESLALDLNAAPSRKILHRLAIKSDVLLHNFLDADLGKFGLQEAKLKELNPKLVLSHIQTFSHERKAEPGYDLLVQALSGFMAITGPAGLGGYKVGVAVVDVMTGLYTAIGILAKLYQQKVGQGKSFEFAGEETLPRVDVSLFQSAMHGLANIVHTVANTGREIQAQGNAHAQIVPYQSFSAADMDFCLAVGNDQQFARLAEALQLTQEFRMRQNAERVEKREVLVKVLQEKFSMQPRAFWLDLFAKHSIPAAPIHTVTAALEEFPEVVLSDAGGEKFIRNPIALDGSFAKPLRSPPRLGEHNREILRELLDFSAEEIEQMAAQGAFGA